MPESGVAYWDLPFEWRLAERPLGATARDPPPPAPGTDPRAHRAGGPADNPTYDATGAELPSEASKAAAAARAAALTTPAFFRIPVWNGSFEGEGGNLGWWFWERGVPLAFSRVPHPRLPRHACVELAHALQAVAPFQVYRHAHRPGRVCGGAGA